MNRLAHESSPYLLQHAANPVDWYPWGDEAFQAAKDRDCPIFLSIGYSACHWCHVMEHESFDNVDIAALMNERFVNIKIDREERPDLDQIYMNSVMAMTGRGGWPMSVFLTHELKPFFSGTYWPPEAKMGMPGFRQILTKISDAWQQRRSDVEGSSGELADIVAKMSQPGGANGSCDEALLHSAMGDLLQAADGTYGGFGSAPKFPHPMDLRLLLRCWKRFNNSDAVHVVKLSCDRMAAGGIYDHLGGGFARYSTDARWLAPHFEKMLYDNGLLTSVYAEAFVATKEPEYERVLRETLDYVLREMTLDSGAFCSAQDADSEGEEGKFFVWSQREVEELLGKEDARIFCSAYDVTTAGNWEAKNILNRPQPLSKVAEEFGITRDELVAKLEPLKLKLFEQRSQRIAPGTDDKVITAWNGMMISGMALMSRVLNEPRYATAAARACDYIWTKMRKDDGRLFHTARHDKPTIDAFLDDYACLIDGLIELHQTTFDEDRLSQAAELADIVLEDFSDDTPGAFFYTPESQATPIARIKDSQDGATPSGNSMLATALLKLSVLTGRTDFRDTAESILSVLESQLRKSPMSGGQALIAIDHLLSPMPDVVIRSASPNMADSKMLAALNTHFHPGLLVAWRGADAPSDQASPINALFESRPAPSNGETAWVCHNGGCLEPVTTVDGLMEQLDSLR
ncbi:thioredoxin domain-containing protein [Fuerstiella marisgermanici]|uniref:Thioredoxin-related protein n=1 Tax=Fuerstiella marisgermanici TaxID=1891926 RepID=A0A1P8WJZ4_9PLAN|nr:thioredoxin domain-containing protein [Fuerstiella marisgermanici]APZ94387.1 Thioredoxin-related protein [Fuerstiella marisgermanici]